EACRRHDLFIRDASNLGSSLGSHSVRIAVKDAPTNRRIISTLSQVVRQTYGARSAGETLRHEQRAP
ncbi:MAG: hypothetical protein V3T07_06065, partial [Myxococcota bacterium]